MPGQDFQIVIDTREQSPLVFPSREVKTIKEALSEGDYGIKIQGTLQPIRIERKSIPDLFNSFRGENYRRERNKITRAQEDGLRYIIVIEGSCSAVRKGHRYYKAGKWHETKKDGLTQVRQLERISQKYEVEVRYCSDRDDMAFMCQEILLNYVRHYDDKKVGTNDR
jgi:ERCC4-type nuclease